MFRTHYKQVDRVLAAVLYPTLVAVTILTSAVWFVVMAAIVVVVVVVVAVAEVVSLLADIVSTFGTYVTRMTCACDAYDIYHND